MKEKDLACQDLLQEMKQQRVQGEIKAQLQQNDCAA